MDEAACRSKLQWFTMRGGGGADKEQQRFGNGALRFIRTRASVRRDSKRFGNRSKSGEKGATCHQVPVPPAPVSSRPQSPGLVSSTANLEQRQHPPQQQQQQSVGGGFGRWLREHLTSKGAVEHQLGKKRQQQQLPPPTQNLYCSLPRERSRRKLEHRRASCRIVPVADEPQRPPLQRQQQQVFTEDEATVRRRARAAAKAERRRHSMSEFHTEQHRARRSRRCFPDGGEVGYKMTTELQPSPPGYRTAGQEELLPGKLYRGGHHGYSGAAPEYQPPPPRRSRSSPEAEPQTGDGKILDSYEDQGYCKKNAPGYKNDSGYSESLGFESFSLALSERDAASPPPTPPVRDASSLKAVCYGPGHEKYPSWPSAPERHYGSNEAGEDGPGKSGHQQHAHGGSHRSKSWTEHTNYPKEKPAQYTRPHNKRPNSTFTQQLKTVMERCEKIPAETFESRSRNKEADQQQPRLWPSVDREGKSLGDAEYVVPSPPERESLQGKTLSPADLEAYVRSYQDPQVSQVELYGENELNQTGLEEYTTVQHSQQASYAQSEGYHSYVSSVDSTTTTPFLDRLRRDSEAVAQRPLTAWEDGSSREGRDSVVTTSSGSASSSETLKWHGSMSDVSVSSGMPASRTSGLTQDRWHHGSMSDVSSINGACPQKPAEPGELDKWQDSLISEVEHQHNGHHHQQPLKPRPSGWQAAMNDRNKEHSEEKQWESHGAPKGFHEAGEWEHSLHSSMSDVSQVNGTAAAGAQGSKQLIAHSARVQTPQRHHSESVLYLDRERSQRKLYPVSTTKLDEIHPSSRLPTTSPPQVQPSVAERVSELEKQQQQMMRYTFLDPEKRHRVSDPTLKAIQKKALMSFYERHQQRTSWRSEPQLQQDPQQLAQQRHSPPPQPPPRPRPVSSRRASSASDYATGGWREKNTATAKTAAPQQPSSPSATDLPTPRHQHSNSCGSLSTDLLGPVIVGPAISIDDWVPERPPKKPHLRNAYSDRLPSPDLPPPSPPTVTDLEVLNFDDPLPPPPPELSHICTAEPRNVSPEVPYYDEPTPDRIKERNSTSRRSSRKKQSVESSPTSSPTKPGSGSPNQERFHFEHKPSSHEAKPPVENGFVGRVMQSGRSSLRYSSAQKHLMNEKIAAMRRSVEDRLAPYGLANPLPDLMPQKYSDSGHQRPAPQVPVASSREVEPKIKRQESFKQDDTLKQQQHWLESSSRQKPRPQAPSQSKSPRNSLGKYQPRGYMALPTKYPEAPPPPPPPLDPGRDSPPPLAPRTPGKKLSPPPRPAPPLHAMHQGSQSKASYLAYRRERGAPDSEGSYKRTMSPNARLDDPVLLKVTPHHQQPLINNNSTTTNNNSSSNNNLVNNNNNNNNQYQPRHYRAHELSKSQSSDGLQQQRLHEQLARAKSVHNVGAEPPQQPPPPLENGREESGPRRTERRERLSPQSVEVLNDRNRQLERERRKLAASCEPQARLVEDFYRESAVTTIEMTSHNVEMLNRRNEKQRLAQPIENRSPSSSSPKFSESPSAASPQASPTSPSAPSSPIRTPSSPTETSPVDRKVSSPSQTERWERASASGGSSPRSSPRAGGKSPASSNGSPRPDLVEGLSFVQRTEIVLRVNTATNDVASQTEAIADEQPAPEAERPKPEDEAPTESLAKPRPKLPEEIECEELSRDLANQLGPNDKLLPILVPAPEHKKSTDYVVDLFRVEAAIQPRPRPKLSIEDPTLMDGLDNESEDDKKIDSIPSTPVTPSATDSSSGPLSPSSVYFTTSESKARFLTRYSQDVVGDQVTTAASSAATAGATSPSINSTPDNLDLRQKKEELMIRLDKKLVVLRAEQEAVREEGEVNEALGARVSSRVSAVARPAEASKYRLHVEEVGKITSLLLGLSGRLARAENALYGMPADHAERKILEAKRDKLIDQLEEAKILKSNIDRRSVNVSAILSKYLSDEEFADYQHFINMKAKLIVDSREIQDKVKLGEEQLAALKEAIDL